LDGGTSPLLFRHRRCRFALVTALTLVVPLLAASTLPDIASGYTPRGPIYIDGNGDFAPGNGVTGGNGTWDDPYLIQGWEVGVVSSWAAIEIRNTDAHFVIDAVHVFNPSGRIDAVGLRFANVTNGVVSNSLVEDLLYAVQFPQFSPWSSNITLARSEFRDNGWMLGCNPTLCVGADRLTVANNTIDRSHVELRGSTNVSILGNTFVDSGIARSGSSSRGIVIAFNTMTNGSIWAQDTVFIGSPLDMAILGNAISNGNIFLSQADNVIIQDNSLSNAGATGLFFDAGLYLDLTSNVQVSGNTISGPLWGVVVNGILFPGQPISITGNVVANTSYGISGGASAWTPVHHNCLLSNAVHGQGPGFWDNGYPSGGNYWDDYGGVDLFSGPLQDQPGGDGIGDTPHLLMSGGVDRYPLMTSGGGSCVGDFVPPTNPLLLSAELAGGALGDLLLTWRAAWDEFLPGGPWRTRSPEATRSRAPSRQSPRCRRPAPPRTPTCASGAVTT